LKDALKEGHIDDSKLSEYTSADCKIEHPISSQGQLSSKDAFALTSAGKGIEHIEEDKAGEGHRRVSSADALS